MDDATSTVLSEIAVRCPEIDGEFAPMAKVDQKIISMQTSPFQTVAIG
jgi:hypothetical protein